MRRGWSALGVLVVASVAATWRRAPPVAAEPARARVSHRVHRAPSTSVVPEIPDEIDEVDEGWVASTVRDAMRQPGDSDRRLLDLLGTTGLRPGRLATVGAALDPWLGLGLLDLDRQVSRRCARLTGDEACWDEADDAEDALRDVLDEDWLAALDELRPR